MRACRSHVSRRGFLAGSASLVARARRAAFAPGRSRVARARSVEGPYGPLRPAPDLETGLPLILPAGRLPVPYVLLGGRRDVGRRSRRRTCTTGWASSRRAAAATRSRSRWSAITSARFARPILAPARYDTINADGAGLRAGGRHDDAEVPRPAMGQRRAFARRHDLQLRGRRDALGHLAQLRGDRHRPDGARRAPARLRLRSARRTPPATTAKPIVDMGRMLHEAVAIDPATNIAYLTEDNPGHSGFYRLLRRTASGTPGSYEAGGRLQAARVIGQPNADLRAPAVGDVTTSIGWTSRIRMPIRATPAERRRRRRPRADHSSRPGPRADSWMSRG